MPRLKRFVPFLMLVVTALACAIPGVTQPGVDVISTSAAETVIAGLTQNVTPTAIPSNTPSLTPTFTPTLIYLTPRIPSATSTLPVTPGTATLTLEPAATPTLVSIEMSVTRPTHCRTGPGKAYEIVGSLLVGMTVPVIGRDPTGEYWYIPNPYVFTDYCWVWGEYANFTGPELQVPVMTPPATPTSTGTPIPSIDFKIQFRGVQTCNGAHWVNIEIINLSQRTLSSIKIEMQDTTQNIFRSVTYNNFPYSQGCEKMVVVNTLPGDGQQRTVSGPRFDYNLRGNALRAFITLCTEENLQGICSTREFKFNP